MKLSAAVSVLLITLSIGAVQPAFAQGDNGLCVAGTWCVAPSLVGSGEGGGDISVGTGGASGSGGNTGIGGNGGNAGLLFGTGGVGGNPGAPGPIGPVGGAGGNGGSFL